MNRIPLVTAVAVGMLTGCAADTTKIQATYVSPQEFASFDCDQVRAENDRVTRRAEEVGAVVDKTAADDQAQAAIGIILLWPALFLLEGEDTQQTREYAGLKGRLETLHQVAVEKGCGATVQQAVAPAGAAPAGGTAAPAPPRALRLAVVPFAAADHMHSVTMSIANDDLARVVRAVLREERRVELAFSPHEERFDRAAIGPDAQYWRSGTGGTRPVERQVHALRERIAADLALTVHVEPGPANWSNPERYRADVYVIDLRAQRTYRDRADETNIRPVTERLLRRAVDGAS